MSKANRPTDRPISSLIAYYRLSQPKKLRRVIDGVLTWELIADPLGIDVQRRMVAEYARVCNLPVLREYTEIETGRKFSLANRPKLSEALADVRRTRGSQLVIAKLDRLARNVAFVSSLLESSVPFVAVDMPEADIAMLQMHSVFAEHEGRVIAARTKAALAERKRRGLPIGTPANLTDDARRKGNAVACAMNREAARLAYSDIADRVVKLRGEGVTFAGIAEGLNGEGVGTVTGAAWCATKIRRLCLRLGVE